MQYDAVLLDLDGVITAHGSSLSTGMHALVAARLGDAAMALHYLRATAASDLENRIRNLALAAL